jgi:hypothetical protein
MILLVLLFKTMKLKKKKEILVMRLKETLVKTRKTITTTRARTIKMMMTRRK